MSPEQARVSLPHMIEHLKYWRDWNKADRDREGIETTDDSQIICVPPSWPTHGMLTVWIEALEELEKMLPDVSARPQGEGE